MKYANDVCENFTPEIGQYLWTSTPKPLEEIQQHILTKQDQMKSGEEIALFVLHKESLEFLGYTSINKANTSTPEIGIWIKKSAHGNQYGYEALKLLKEWAEQNLDYEYMKYPVDKNNISSRKLIERLGGSIGDEYVKKSESGNTLNTLEYRIYKQSI